MAPWQSAIGKGFQIGGDVLVIRWCNDLYDACKYLVAQYRDIVRCPQKGPTPKDRAPVGDPRSKAKYCKLIKAGKSWKIGKCVREASYTVLARMRREGIDMIDEPVLSCW